MAGYVDLTPRQYALVRFAARAFGVTEGEVVVRVVRLYASRRAQG